jgi:hypothetical protein
MSNGVTQQLPVALVACVLTANAFRDGASLESSNVATLEWRVAEGLPTVCSSSLVQGATEPEVGSAGLALRALGRAVLPESRPMEDRERKHADAFFWSHFSR